MPLGCNCFAPPFHHQHEGKLKAVIGNQLIKTLKPEAKSYDVRDSKLPGFVLRVLPSGTMTYLANYARGKHYTIGRASVHTPVQAREQVRKILAAVVNGVDPMAERKSSRAYTLKSYIRRGLCPLGDGSSKMG